MTLPILLSITLDGVLSGEYAEYGDVSFHTDRSIKLSREHSSATYHLSGEMRTYELCINPELNVYVSFSPNGAVGDIITHGFPMCMWNPVKDYWFVMEGPDADVPASLAAFNPETYIKENELDISNPKTLKSAPATINDAMLSKYGMSSVEELYTLVKDNMMVPGKPVYTPPTSSENPGYYTIAADAPYTYNGKTVLVLVEGRKMTYDAEKKAYILESNMQNDRPTVALLCGGIVTITRFGSQTNTVTGVGPFYYAPDEDGFQMWGERDTARAIYDKNGNRLLYFVISDDYRTQTAYDNHNNLASHEYWDGDFNYWGYFDGTWTTATDGGSGEWVEGAVPTLEVLESRLFDAKETVTYDAAKPLSSASQLSDELEGTPFIVGADAFGNAEVEISTTMKNVYTTEYDITPTTQPTKTVDLYLSLPQGFDTDLAEKYGVTVEHNGEVYSTFDGTAKIVGDSVLVKTDSFSPYYVSWGEEAERVYKENTGSGAGNLPKTGDESRMALWFACMLLSAAGIALMIRRNRAAE